MRYTDFLLLRVFSQAIMLAGSLIFLSGCSTIPSSGPTRNDIEGSTFVDGVQRYEIKDISPENFKELSTKKILPINFSFNASELGPSKKILIGDTLKLTLFELGVSLFSDPGGGLNTKSDYSAKNITFDDVVVDNEGSIYLPYLGKIEAQHHTPYELARKIERALSGKSQHPQVLVSITDSPKNKVYVSGVINKPGSYRLSNTLQTLLDAITLAGGSSSQPYDTVVRLTRNNEEKSVRLSEVTPQSPLNIRLAAGDRVELLKQPITFTVFGAASNISNIPFEGKQLTLAEAIGKFSGLKDNQADPEALYLFRQDSYFNVETPKIIYRINLLKPESLFLVQQISMQDKDLVYVANARINMTAKVISIINQLFSPIFTIRALTN